MPVGLLFLFGIVFTEETKDTQIMNRNQTVEWKGIFQLARYSIVL